MFSTKAFFSNYVLSNLFFIIIILIIRFDTIRCLDKSFIDDVDNNLLDDVDKNATEIVRERGFIAKEHKITTTDGYVLNLIQITNPLIRSNDSQSSGRRKDVVLLIHGGITTSTCFVSHSLGVRPKDYSNFDAGQMNLSELKSLLSNEPSNSSIVFLMLNFGHEVWIMNRRASIASSSEVINYDKINGFYDYRNSIFGKKSIKYWNFTLDEQAQYDFPETIDYILKQTNREKLSFIGHSFGGTIPLLSLSIHPKLHLKSKFIELFSWLIEERFYSY